LLDVMLNIISPILTFIILILVGFLSLRLSTKIKLPYPLILLCFGYLFTFISSGNLPIMFSLSPKIIFYISLFTLMMLLFDVSESFKMKKLDTLSHSAIKIGLMTLLFALIITPFIFIYLLDIAFELEVWIILFILIFFLCEIYPEDIFHHAKRPVSKIVNLVEHEYQYLPVIFLSIPFLLLGIADLISSQRTIQILFSLAIDIITSVGVGVLVGIMSIRYMKRLKSDKTIPVALFALSILSFILTELLGGNGLFSIIVFGLFFGNVYIKHTQLEEFSPTLSNILEMMIYLHMGMLIGFYSDKIIIIASVVVYFFYLFYRYISITIFQKRMNIKTKEKLYFTLMSPKGSITVATLLLLYVLFNHMTVIPSVSLSSINQLSGVLFFIVILSIIISWVTHINSSYFLGKHD